MAINPVNSPVDNKLQRQPKTSVAFKGAADILPNLVTTTMDGIARGGYAASFVTQDMLGMAAPRVATGLNRGREETGHYNWAFAKSEAYREFLSGPSTFLIPALMLYGVGKSVGTAVKVPSKFIKELGENFAEFAQTQPTAVLADKAVLKQNYYEHAIKSVLEGSTNGELQGKKLNAAAKSFAKRLIEIENQKNRPLTEKIASSFENAKNSIRNIFVKKEDRITNKTAKRMTEKLINDFSSVKRKFTGAEASTFGSNLKNGTVNTSFGDFIQHLQNYTTDATKSISKKFKPEAGKTIKEFMENFTYKRVGGRFLTTLAMTTAVMSFFTFIPKLYKSKDGKNHALDGLVPPTPTAPQATTAPQAAAAAPQPAKVEGK